MGVTEEQGQHGGRSNRQEQAVETVQAETLVGRHGEMPKEQIERAMDPRVV